MTALTGSCLCGAVEFSLDAGRIDHPSACHCGQCRRWSGHVWASLNVPKADFSVTRGEDKSAWFASSALVAKSYWDDYHEHGLPNSSVVFTIHNFGYGEDAIGEAAMYSQKFTTVSPSYANEIRHEGCIAQYSEKFT